MLAYAGFMWLWHIPAMYDAALRHSDIHAVEHICFVRRRILTGGTCSRRSAAACGSAAWARSATWSAPSCWSALLGIALAFAPTAFYPFYAHHPHYWGLSPREDQKMAGLVMALEQSIVMGIALVVLFVQMLTESEREAQRAERFEVA